ncbi:MAG: flagellar hook-associated protein FlgL [Gammaproteobacteria bacterium]|nr:flagellar hook-associated protein FlgL [Gammaproteobacteria bacterium]
MRISTNQMFRQGFDAIARQQNEVVAAQQQVATGRRFSTPAQDPSGAARALDLRGAISVNEQHRAVAASANTRLVVQEQALAASENVLQRIREIALQATSSTLTQTDRDALAAEVDARFNELLGLANTKDANGEFLFAGNKTNTQPFTQGASVSYNGDQGARELEIAPGFRVNVSHPGDVVFAGFLGGNGAFTTSANTANTGSGLIGPGTVLDPGTYSGQAFVINFTTATTYEVRDNTNALVHSGSYVSGQDITFGGIAVSVSGTPNANDQFSVAGSQTQSVFDTVTELSAALRAPSVAPEQQALVFNRLGSVVGNVDQAQAQLSGVRARVGAQMNVVDSQLLVAEDFSVQLQTALSDVENVDLAQAVTRLNQRLVSLEAAQRSFAAVQGLSLFNYL